MSFRAFLVASSAIFLTACGGGGGGNQVSLGSSAATPDRIAPELTFSSGSISVESGQTQSNDLRVTDNVAITSSPTVTCTNGGVFENNIFTAPTVTDEVEVTCEASLTDAAGNTGYASFTATITPEPDEVTFTVTGSAFKGLFLGAPVLITDANDPDIVLAETTTSETDGRFDIALTYEGRLNVDYLRVEVKGGEQAQMICDAAPGCGGAAFGDPFAIDSNFGLIGMYPVPANGGELTADLSMVTDLSASLVEAPVNNDALEGALIKTKTLFGFAADMESITALDVMQAGASGTQESARLALISGGLLQSLYETGQEPGLAYNSFRDEFQENLGEIIVKESVDDGTVISLEDIYSNIEIMRSVVSSQSENLNAAFDEIEAELIVIDTEVIADRLTTSGALPLKDIQAPSLSFTPETVSVVSGETVSVAAQITDADPNAYLTSSECTGGSYDIDTGLYTSPSNVFQNAAFICTVGVQDTSGNVGSGTFSVSMTGAADTEAPLVSFDPNTFTIASGQTSEFALTATDNVGIVGGIDVTCTNGGRLEDGLFIAPNVSSDTEVICTAIATDAAGNSSSATLTVSVTPTPDTTAPTVSFSPNTIALESGETLAAVLSVSDNIGLAGPAEVVCTNGGTFADGIFTAPSVTESVTSICTATATDSSGNTASATLTAEVSYIDRVNPAVEFTPDTISLEAGETAAVSLMATDNIAIEGDVLVECTNGGLFSDGIFTAPQATEDLTSICTATATDTSGNEATATLTAQVSFVDETPPIVSFDPSAMTINSDESLRVVLSASDNIALDGDVSVACTNGGVFADNLFTAPAVTEETTSVCTATAVDTSGNEASAVLTAQITFAPDTEDPVITVNTEGPYTIVGESSIPFSFTVTDNVTVASQSMSCDNSNLTYADGQLKAEFTKTAYITRCSIFASDSSSNRVVKSISANVTVSPNEPPVVSFNPAIIYLEPGGTGTVEISATDRHGSIADGPNVTCTDGVTYSGGVITAPDTTIDLNAVCTASVTDDQGLTGREDLDVRVKVDSPNRVVTGIVTFDIYDTDPETNLFNRDLVTLAAKGVTVEVLNAADEVIAVAGTDETGYYEAELEETGEVRVRVATEIQQTAAPDSPITYQERFNARPERSSPTAARFTSGLVTQEDIHFSVASSIAAKLNVLDVIYLGMKKVKAVDDTLIFPKLDINQTESGSQISERYGIIPKNVESHYSSTVVNDVERRFIKLATSLNNDDNSDLSDRHVVAHMWAHYLEDAFGRYDSPGLFAAGNVTDRHAALDPRVAFSEGFANAMAGMILDDPIYKDTFKATEGNRRFDAVAIADLENEEVDDKGWFSTASVQSIIWDLYDDTNETYPTAGGQMDTRSVGFEGIFNALRHPLHKDTKYFTTIYSFREALDVVTASTEVGIFTYHNIYARDALAESESNNGGDPLNLPIFSVKGDEDIELCSNLRDDKALGYTLGIVKSVSFSVEEEQTISFMAVSSEPFGESEPEMIIYDEGVEVARTSDDQAYGDNVLKTLEPGDYMVTIFDNDNFLGTTNNGSICMDLSGG